MLTTTAGGASFGTQYLTPPRLFALCCDSLPCSGNLSWSILIVDILPIAVVVSPENRSLRFRYFQLSTGEITPLHLVVGTNFLILLVYLLICARSLSVALFSLPWVSLIEVRFSGCVLWPCDLIFNGLTSCRRQCHGRASRTCGAWLILETNGAVGLSALVRLCLGKQWHDEEQCRQDSFHADL
jgi:hypothetical protein